MMPYVASSTSAIIENLNRAIIDVNFAASANPQRPFKQERSLRRLSSALRDAVAHEPLWEELSRQATSANQPGGRPDAEAFLVQIASFLGNAHANLLRRVGYQVPPPPPAEHLVEQTRRSVLWGDRRPRWGRLHVETARGELYTYVNRLDIALNNSSSRLADLIGRARQVGTVGLLLIALSHVEFKPASSPDVELTLSTKDWIQIEVSVPVSWVTSQLNQLRATMINSQSANFGLVIDEASEDLDQVSMIVSPPRLASRWFAEARESRTVTNEVEQTDEPTNQWSTHSSPSKSPISLHAVRHGLEEVAQLLRTEFEHVSLAQVHLERAITEFEDVGMDQLDRSVLANLRNSAAELDHLTQLIERVMASVADLRDRL